MNTRRVILLISIFMACAGATYGQGQGQGRAQGPRPKPEMTAWWDQPVAHDLNLTEEQNRQIRAIVAESRDRLLQLRAAVDSAEGALRDAMDEEKVDVRRAESAIEKVVATRAEMMRAVSQMSLRLRVILTSAQWQELERRESQPPPPQPGLPQKKKSPEDFPPAPFRTPHDDVPGLIARLFSGLES